METNDYLVGFQRLKSQFGNNALTDIELDYVFDYLKKHNVYSNQWIEICNKIICSRKSVPTVFEFFDLINNDIKKNKNIYEPRFKETKSGIDCKWCKDVGFCFVTKGNEGGRAFVFCDCDRGVYKMNLPVIKLTHMPMWGERLIGEGFKKSEVPHEFYIPEKSSEVMDSINKKVAEFKEKLKASNEFWKSKNLNLNKASGG